MAILLTVLAVLSLAAHLLAASAGEIALVFLFKPLTTSLVFALAWTLGLSRMRPGTVPAYAMLIAAGLLCSIGGDVFLMIPGEWFIQGLLVFLLAHVCYIAAFATRAGRPRLGASLLPYGLAYALLVGRLAPHVGPLLAPVAIYGAALIVMAWYARQAWLVKRTRPAAGAAIGAVLFVVSDTLLAFGRFVPGAPRSELAVMTTYVAAQLLIAWSIAAGGEEQG